MIQMHKLNCESCFIIVFIPSDLFDRTFSVEDVQLCPHCFNMELVFDGIWKIHDFEIISQVKELELVYNEEFRIKTE